MERKRTIEVLKALADETRIGIVRKLAQAKEPVGGCDIVQSCASRMALSQPAMSHHFGKLVDAGVIVETKSGTSKLYTLNTKYLASMGIDVTKL
jgi:DNA-binding transcriptional ArsR family regulator